MYRSAAVLATSLLPVVVKKWAKWLTWENVPIDESELRKTLQGWTLSSPAQSTERLRVLQIDRIIDPSGLRIGVLAVPTTAANAGVAILKMRTDDVPFHERVFVAACEPGVKPCRQVLHPAYVSAPKGLTHTVSVEGRPAIDDLIGSPVVDARGYVIAIVGARSPMQDSHTYVEAVGLRQLLSVAAYNPRPNG